MSPELKSFSKNSIAFVLALALSNVIASTLSLNLNSSIILKIVLYIKSTLCDPRTHSKPNIVLSKSNFFNVMSGYS